MSSFPVHVDNIKALKDMGFDVSDAIEDGKVTLDSWGYDELTYLLDDVITKLIMHNFKVKANDKDLT